MRAPATVLLLLNLSAASHAFSTTSPHRRRACRLRRWRDVVMSDTASLALSLSTSYLPHIIPNAWHEYDRVLHEHPLEAKVLTAAVCAAAGDFIAQRSSASGSFAYDQVRALAFMAFGATYGGAFQHFFFDYLNVVYAADGPLVMSLAPSLGDVSHVSTDQLAAAAKAATNLFGAVPFLYMPLSLAFTGVVAGLDREAAMARARSMYVSLLRRYYSFWLPINYLAFCVIPTAFVVPFFCASSIVWNAILSVAGRQVQAQTAADMVALAEIGLVFDDLPEPTVDEFMDAVRLEDVASAAEEALAPACVAAGAAIGSVALQAASELESTTAAMGAIEFATKRAVAEGVSATVELM